MANEISRCCWLLGSLVLGAALLAAQSQPQSQPPSAQQQELEALADKLIAAPNEEARNALLAANTDLVTVELPRILNLRGNKLLTAGTKTSLAQARAIYDIALTIAERMSDKKGIAACFDRIGLVLQKQGEYESALDYAHRAIAIDEELKDPRLASDYNNIGNTLLGQGNYREAADYYNHALKLWEAQGSKEDIAKASNNLGIAYVRLGNQRLALEQYNKSMEISQALGLQLGVAFNTNNLGNLYVIQGDYELALSYYEQSLKIKEKVANKRDIAITLMNIGMMYHQMGKDALARERMEKALNLVEAVGDKDGTAIVLQNYGYILRDQGNYTGALERYQASLSLGQALGNKARVAGTLFEMARTYYAQRDYTRSLEFGQRAAEITRRIGATPNLAQTLNITARALAELGKAEEARSTLAEAIDAIEELRGQVAGAEEEQLDFLAARIEPYQNMVQLLLSQNKAEEAFSFAEKAKARVLLDVMRSGRIRVDKAMTAQENEQERRLVNQLTSLNARLSAEKLKPTPDSTNLAQLGAELQKARLDYRGFQSLLYAAHPELQAERSDAKPASLAETASLLPDARTALLEFVVAEDKAYLFVMVKGVGAGAPQLNSYTLPVGAKELTRRVTDFREQLATRNPDYGESALALYRLLLRPAQAALVGKTTIVIVPDGPLWELPFQALQPSAGHHLLENAAISYAPSLTVLLEMARRHRDSRSAAPRLLALGNPALKQAEDLPSAQREVAALARLYGAQRSRVYSGGAANKQIFKAEAGKYDVLHLATHGIFDDRSPMYSHLMLSERGNNSGEDGLLEAWEVINLELKADLVVLSACETARGKTSSGEGLIGMAWAFFVAGSPSMVASQWKVDSESTTDLMLDFHRTLRSRAGLQGHSAPKARALQQAALSVMKRPEYRHPFYWAGFVLIGDGL